MRKKRTQTWYAIGVVSDKLVRDLREQMRRDKILSAVANAQEVYRGGSIRGDRHGTARKESGNGAPVDDDHSHLTAEDSAIRGNGSGGTKT